LTSLLLQLRDELKLKALIKASLERLCVSLAPIIKGFKHLKNLKLEKHLH